MDVREAALRFWAGDRLDTRFLKKVEAVERPLLQDVLAFVGEPKLAPRILRLVPLELAKDFFELLREPVPEVPGGVSTTAWARKHRHQAAQAVFQAVFEVSEKRPKRALELLRALFSSDEPDTAWGARMREAAARFGIVRFQELATRVFEIEEGFAAQVAERLIWTAVHSARGAEAIRALVEDARRDARSGSTRPRAAIAVARALRGADPELARPELERMKVRVRHKVVLREVEKSLRALGEGREAELPPGVTLDAEGTLVFEGKPDRKARRTAEELLSVQRALLEQQMVDETIWTLPEWRARFLGHSVLENLARRVLWLGDGKPAFFVGERFLDLDDRPLEPSELRVAHPVHLRDLERAQARALAQPFKQLFRETYTVTPSERGEAACTRFVNEIVPYDTLYALTKQRGWSGLYTQPGEGPAEGRKDFAQGCRARLGIQEARHAIGVCLGVLTFETKVKREITVHPLGVVPPVVFSEACRDLDLVVSVASIGEDATGVVPARVGTRTALVERILPALGLRDRARVQGRFVLVQGELHRYRVHLASGNVHVVPSHRAIVFPENLQAPEVFLPPEAEADPRTAEIVRRVLILAGDAFVTDPELASQLAEA